MLMGFFNPFPYPVSPVELLLHFDEADAATTFADASKNVRTISRYGSAQASNINQKFSNNLVLDGNNDSIYFDNNTAIGSGDYTIDFWMMRSGSKSAGVMDFRNATSDADPFFEFTGADVLRCSIDNGIRFTSGAIAVNTWYHVALIRRGAANRLFLNGTQVGSDYTSATAFAGTKFTAGTYVDTRNNGSTSFHMNGRLEEIRYIKGVAVWTAGFTPPSAPYVADAI